MKKVIIALIVIGFTSVSASLENRMVKQKSKLTQSINEKYKDCMDACLKTISSCEKVIKTTTKSEDPNQIKCLQLCKESVSICKAAYELMSMNSDNAKSIFSECTKICDECARECDRFSKRSFKKCATNCRKTAKLCNEM